MRMITYQAHSPPYWCQEKVYKCNEAYRPTSNAVIVKEGRQERQLHMSKQMSISKTYIPMKRSFTASMFLLERGFADVL